MAAEIKFLNGNVHTPVVVCGDDPSEEGNVLVVSLGVATSIPKDHVADANTTVATEGETDA